jgi:hypothetical protein
VASATCGDLTRRALSAARLLKRGWETVAPPGGSLSGSAIVTSAEPPSPHRFEVWGRPGQGSRASFRDGIVYRESGPWSATILSLLDHLKETGFEAAPRVVGSGLSPDGYEMVTYVPGDTPREPFVWTNEAMFALG